MLFGAYPHLVLRGIYSLLHDLNVSSLISSSIARQMLILMRPHTMLSGLTKSSAFLELRLTTNKSSPLIPMHLLMLHYRPPFFPNLLELLDGDQLDVFLSCSYLLWSVGKYILVQGCISGRPRISLEGHFEDQGLGAHLIFGLDLDFEIAWRAQAKVV